MGLERTEDAAALLSGDVAAKVHFLKKDRYVEYDRAESIMRAMLELMEGPSVIRPDNLIVLGETNNGKTTLVKQFIKDFAAPSDNPEEEAARVPALYVHIPPGDLDEHRLYHVILRSLGAPYRENDRVDKKMGMVLRLIPRLGVRLLILDEFHHILTSSGARQRRMLNAVKTLSNELGISIVATGIPETLPLLRSDPQIHNRFEVLTLPRWPYNDAFLEWLAGLETDLPLRDESNLIDDTLSNTIWELGEGLMGESARVVRKAAISAIRDGEERITLERLQALRLLPPSRRDKHVENELFEFGKHDHVRPG